MKILGWICVGLTSYSLKNLLQSDLDFDMTDQALIFMICDMIYLLTVIGLSPGGSSTVHIYTQTIHRTTQNKQYIEQRNNYGRVRAVPSLG